jgi:hypothetical protein
MNDTPIVEHEKAPDGEAALRNRRETILHDSMGFTKEKIPESRSIVKQPTSRYSHGRKQPFCSDTTGRIQA